MHFYPLFRKRTFYEVYLKTAENFKTVSFCIVFVILSDYFVKTIPFYLWYKLTAAAAL